MNLSEPFIRRPVMTLLVMSAILFFGGVIVGEVVPLVQWMLEMRRKDKAEDEGESTEATVPALAPVQANLVFVDHEATLTLGDAVAHLPPTKNEHCFCRAMFKYRINEPVDWSLPYEEMTGDREILNHEKAKRMVYDTTKTLNSRAKNNLGVDELFSWQGKTIKRTK